MAKDETEEGITGLPIPKKKMSPKKRHEFEKKRREARKERNDPRAGDSFSQHRMTGSRGHGSENVSNPRVSYRHNEEYLIDYLLDEGFASDEKSAFAIFGAMSEEWKQNIMDGFKRIDKDKEERMYRRSGDLAQQSLKSKGDKKYKTAKKSATIVGAIVRQKEKERFDDAGKSPKHNP